MAAFTPTAEMHQAYKATVRHDLVDQARKAHADAQERTKATAADVTTAQAAQVAAKKASDDAIAGRGDVSPMDAEEALEIAERRLRVAQKIHGAAGKARDDAQEAIHRAEGEAHQPAYRQAMLLRFKACLAGDAARKALAEAQQLYEQSAWMLNGAANAGAARFFSGEPTHFAGREVQPLEVEVQYWRQPAASRSGDRWDGNADLAAIIKEAQGK